MLIGGKEYKTGQRIKVINAKSKGYFVMMK